MVMHIYTARAGPASSGRGWRWKRPGARATRSVVIAARDARWAAKAAARAGGIGVEGDVSGGAAVLLSMRLRRALSVAGSAPVARLAEPRPERKPGVAGAESRPAPPQSAGHSSESPGTPVKSRSLS